MEHLQLEIVHRTAVQHRSKGFFKCWLLGRRNDSLHLPSKNSLLLVSQHLPAAVGVTDQASRVSHKDQTLSVVEDFPGEVPFPLQFGLIRFESADVEHQTAILQNTSARIAEREGIDQDMDG